MNKELKKQINYVYLYTFFSGMMFFYGIEQLFLEEIGDGPFARGVILAVFSITMLLANIPTGALSDIWGRVRSLKLALVIMAIALVVLGLSTNVFQYAIGAMLFGLFWSFDEGAKEAFVYDYLEDHDQSEQYQKVLGRIYASLLIGAAVANFSSGFIAELTSLRFTFGISLIPCFIAFYFVSKLHEPEHHKQAGKKVLHQLKDAGKALQLNRALLVIVVAQLLLYTVMSISGEFAQVVIVEFTKSSILLGISWAIIGLLMAAGNLNAHRIKHAFGLIVALLVFIVIFFITRNVWFSIIPLFLFVAGLEIVSIKGENAIQKNTPSKLRATVSSIPGSSSMLLVALLGLWVGSAEGQVGVRIFAVCFPMLLVVLMMWLRVKSHIPKT